MRHSILIVDDDEKIVDVIRLYLERDGYQVWTAYDGFTALDLVRQKRPSLVVLDWLLPHIDGLDLCRMLRRETRTPIIMLTAKSAEEEMLLGLNQGADDFLTKPFRPRELVARIQALLRRSYPDEEHVPELCFRDLSVDLSAHEVRLHGKSVALTPTEFKLLETLMREPGRVFRREELVRHVFGDDYDGVDRTIDVHMMNVRKKIEPQPNAPVYVQTVFGIGYKFSKEGGS